MNSLKKIGRKVWEFLREACGENDYTRYLAAASRRGEPHMSREEFYLSSLDQKYSRPNRCC